MPSTRVLWVLHQCQMVMRISLALLSLQVLLSPSSTSAKHPYEGTTINSAKTRSFISTHDSAKPVSTTLVSPPLKESMFTGQNLYDRRIAGSMQLIPPPPPGPMPEGNMDLVAHTTHLLQTEDADMPP
ncbi:hypothetical protein F4604DRAFT_1921023 [Suillus subluteus]|nr:hypothetical protein F4604DRAFT_1921023 [Suillus subluteus]